MANYGFLIQKPVLVGNYGANGFGLYDVIGNVAEWVSDCYAKDAYRNHGRYPAPVGSPGDTCKRVVRGGSWITLGHPDKNRTSKRRSGSPDGRYNFNGLRVLRVIE